MKKTKLTFKRYEKKYLLSGEQFELLWREIADRIQPDEYFRSTVCSLYYDTGDFELIRHSIEAPIFKEKLRLRSYGVPDEDGEVFVELKKKFKGVVYKRRIKLTEAEAEAMYRRGDPVLRIADERQQLEDWLAGRGNLKDDEMGLKLMRKIIEPGRASRRDVLTFASRLFLYPPVHGLRFQGGADCLSFRDAVKFAKIDPSVRMMAALKAKTLPIFGSGHGADMTAAVYAYEAFLIELAKCEKSEQELKQMLYAADEKLNIAFERAVHEGVEVLNEEDNYRQDNRR